MMNNMMNNTMNNISDSELMYSNNSMNNYNKVGSIFILLIYPFQLFLLYKLVPHLFLDLARLFYFFSLYLVNYQDIRNF